MLAESPTPRTDAHIKEMGPIVAGNFIGSHCSPNFARTLEKDLNDARRELGEANKLLMAQADLDRLAIQLIREERDQLQKSNAVKDAALLKLRLELSPASFVSRKEYDAVQQFLVDAVTNQTAAILITREEVEALPCTCRQSFDIVDHVHGADKCKSCQLAAKFDK